MVRLTAEMSLSDWAELAEMQKMCLAVSSNNGNSPSLAMGYQTLCHLCSTRNGVHRGGPVLIMTLELFLNTVSNYSARKNGTLSS